MHPVVRLLLVPIVAALGLPTIAPAATRDDSAPGAQAVEIYQCDFSDAFDKNYDLWPDSWTRVRGPGYPQYLKIGISEPDDTFDRRCLRIELDGGAAKVSTPLAPAGSRFSYVVEAEVRTAGLRHNEAVVVLTFLDADKRVIQEIESEPLRGTSSDWTAIRIGPLAPVSEQTRFAIVSLHVRPTAGGEDLRGEAYLGNVRLARLPRMTLRAGNVHHVFQRGEKVEVFTDISGMTAHDNKVRFELLDAYGKVLDEREQAVRVLPLEAVPGDTKASLAATASWQPKVPDSGFYRVRVSMVGDDGLALERSLALAVINSKPAPTGGEFGWTLPAADQSVDLAALNALLGQAGINWVKYPIWYDEADTSAPDRISWFAERLSLNHVELVGLIDHPPQHVEKVFGSHANPPIASIFMERKLWEPALDPVLTRLSLKVRWWQLGADDDVSYVGYPDMAANVAEVKKSFARFGQDARLGVVWQSQKEPPKAENAAWEFLSYADEPSLTAAQIVQQFGPGAKSTQRRWLTLRPLPSDEYNVLTRVSDLVQRMVAVKSSGVKTAFVPQPFHDRCGLFAADGTPSELFLPWRTTALALSGRAYLGSRRLPGGSTNHVFCDDAEGVMVLWNDHPTREYAYFGDNVRRIDVWGRESKLAEETIDGIRQQVLEVGPEPVILTGLNPKILRWCLSFEFENAQIECLFGREQQIGYRFRNTLEGIASGEVSFSASAIFNTPPAASRIRLAAGEERRDKLTLMLKPDADSGPQPVRIDFHVTAEEEFHFSIHRMLNVGLDDIVIDLDSTLIESGELLVKAHVSNQTGRAVSFRSTLFPPDRRREQQQLLSIGPERVTVTYRLPNGAGLVGEDLRLRLEEISGSRVLNRHLKATP